jgi:hypothetical protein
MDQFELAFVGLNKCRQAFYPIAIVAIQDVLNHANFGFVNVSANHAIKPPAARLIDQNLFKLGDKGHGVFDTMLQILRQRPLRYPQPVTGTVIRIIEFEYQCVEAIAQIRQPLGVLNDPVEKVTMGDP